MDATQSRAYGSRWIRDYQVETAEEFGDVRFCRPAPKVLLDSKSAQRLPDVDATSLLKTFSSCT